MLISYSAGELPCFRRTVGRRIRCESCTSGVCSLYEEHVRKKEERRNGTSSQTSANLAANDSKIALARSKLALAAGRIDTAMQFVSGPVEAIFAAIRGDLEEAEGVLVELEDEE